MVYEYLFVPVTGDEDGTTRLVFEQLITLTLTLTLIGTIRLVFEHLIDFDAKAFTKALAQKQSKVLLLWAGPLAQACNNLGIKRLDVSNISIGDLDAHGLSEILKKSTTIQTLDVRGNQIGDVGCTHLKVLLYYLLVRANPTTLNTNPNSDLKEALAAREGLKEILVEDNLIGEAAMTAIKTAMAAKAQE